MKRLVFIVLLVILGCNKDDTDEREIFIGKLVVKGICMNYVIQVNDDNFPSNMLEENWTNEFSEIGYQNVFALKSVCDFPEDIEEGDTFSFLIDNDKEILCPVCLAYSPIPRKSVSITVTEN
jgi:hypothetical protein